MRRALRWRGRQRRQSSWAQCKRGPEARARGGLLRGLQAHAGSCLEFLSLCWCSGVDGGGLSPEATVLDTIATSMRAPASRSESSPAARLVRRRSIIAERTGRVTVTS